MFCFQISLERQEKIEGPIEVACKQYSIYSVAKKMLEAKNQISIEANFVFQKEA